MFAGPREPVCQLHRLTRTVLSAISTAAPTPRISFWQASRLPAIATPDFSEQGATVLHSETNNMILNTMNCQLLGHSGLRVSDLCLGAMTFGDDSGWGSPKDEA